MTDNDTTPETEDEQFLAEIAAEDESAASAETDTVDAVVVEASIATIIVEPAPPAEPEQDWNTGDIDAALAAVASLSDLMPEREAEAEARADARQSAPTFEPTMSMPPLTTLRRGQLGSIIPALLLIGFGAWLTLNTTSGTPPSPLLVAVVVVGGVALTLLAQWLGTGRWSRGVLFFALVIVLFAGVVVFSIQPGGIDLGRGYPLFIAALGLALTLAGFLARPFNLRMIAPGALLVLAGLTGLVITLGLLPADWLPLATPLAPIVLVVALVLFLLPVLFRRRSQS